MVTLEYARACIDEMHRQAKSHRRTHQTASLGRLLRRQAR